MPVTYPATTATLQANLTGISGFSGASLPVLASAIAQAFTGFLPTIPVTTTHVGIMGAGTGTGKITIDPLTGQSLVAAAMRGVGLQGTSVPTLSAGIASGLATILNTQALVQVVVTGTAGGTGFGMLTGASPAGLTGLLLASFSAFQITGASMPQLAQALGQGIGMWVKTGIVNTVDIGTPVFPFATTAGQGIGFIT